MSTEITPHNKRDQVARLGLFVPEVISGSDRRLKDFFQWCDVREISELGAISSVQAASLKSGVS